MTTLRKQGERNAEGSTRKLIFSYILAQPKGIEELEIRDKLFEETGIGEKRGIIIHFKKLEADKVITLRKGKGNHNVWALNTDFKTTEEFYNAFVFVFSVANYTTNFKTNFLGIYYFLRMNESKINETFLRAFGITIKNKEVQEKLIYMLRLSPTTFNEFITKVVPTCHSIDKELEEKSIRILDSDKEMKEKAIRLLDPSDMDSIKSKFADAFLKTDVSQRKGDQIESYIKTFEIHFWTDMTALFLFGLDQKEFDFEKLKQIFKMKMERRSLGVCSCQYEITQKITVCRLQENQNDTKLVNIHIT